MRVLLVCYDNDSYIHWFPQGLGYIASALRDHGIDVEIYNQDIHHYPDSHLTEYLDNNKFDAIGVSIIAGYYQYRKLLTISEAINASKNRPFYMIGGHGPSPEPEFFLKKTGADLICIGEGEITVCEVMDALAEKRSFHDTLGVAFMDGDKCVQTPRRPLIEDIDSITQPAYDLFPMEVYRLLRMPHCKNSDFVMPILSGRGCTFSCNFCYRMDKGFRPRSTESIIEEVKFLKKEYGITYVAFSDELLMSSIARTEELCSAFIREKLNVTWDCNGRLNYAKPHVLKLMKQAGCVFINYGIEAYDNQILKNMNKALTVTQIDRGIEATLAEGISPGFNLIFGNIGESRETLRKGVDFLLKHDDGSQLRTIRPVTGYPGTELYDIAIEKGLLKDVEDFYTNKHVNSDLVAVNYTDMTDEEFHQALYEANSLLIENYYNNAKGKVVEQARALYLDNNVSFRGFRQT